VPSYTNTIGSAQLASVWTDPDFNATQRAFYYVRVLEIPTPRHSAFDAVASRNRRERNQTACNDPGKGLLFANLVYAAAGPMKLTRILREPLVHFLAAGGLLF
jgi:hypothetical protein